MFAFLRWAGTGAAPVLVVCNMTPVPRQGYRIGVPPPGAWREIFNSDGNEGQVRAACFLSRSRAIARARAAAPRDHFSAA